MKIYDSVHDWRGVLVKNTPHEAKWPEGKPSPSIFCNRHVGAYWTRSKGLCWHTSTAMPEWGLGRHERKYKKKRHCEQRRFKLSVAPSYMKIVKAWGRWHSVLFISKTYAFVVEAIMEKVTASSHRCWLFCCFY
ncbi:hypothetical protein [Cohaesibacter haloalkalitolerans]|uniref:hypothetical protein n=1 Tax=Cohaesibacter haloalkalitolerans TaxID=1162980 RepID=UPI0013C43A8E|nr:hypothetical protein [Cohaesibacter haloalkalitolerans]